MGVNFNLYYLRPTSILDYICILQEMLVLPVIPIFCLVVVAVLLPVFHSIYAENTPFISEIAIKEFFTKRLFFVLLGLYFELYPQGKYTTFHVQHTKTQDYVGRVGGYTYGINYYSHIKPN